MPGSLRSLVPWLQPAAYYLLETAQAHGFPARVTSARRTHGLQAQLYRRYLQGLSQHPVARPGTSYHEFGRAFDIEGPSKSQLAAMGQLWESMGGRWGGRFGDEIHFEA